jgi:hypothetical protein
MVRGKPRQQLRGEFGQLTVLGPAPPLKGRSCWQCECRCGAIVIVLGNSLQTGNTTSCGCVRKARARQLGKANRRHGMRYSAEYAVWSSMIQRCYCPGHVSYHNYGAKGVSVCQRWRDSFEAFFADMGRKPFPKATIDRKHNFGNYEPSNCRWTTMTRNQRNRSNNRMLTYNGITQTLPDLADQFGMDLELVRDRLRRGWTVEAALETPVRQRRQPCKMI